MNEFPKSRGHAGGSVSLVDGEPAIRRARQLMLRSENYDVRSYATCAALLSDPRSRDYSCIVVDVHMGEVDGIDLLKSMRASGWHGRGILLDSIQPGTALMQDAERFGDRVLKRTIADGPLIAAIGDSIDRAGRPPMGDLKALRPRKLHSD